MHGLIFSLLKKHVTTRGGAASWPRLLSAAGIARTYVPIRQYPDEELQALLDALAADERRPRPETVQDFGRALVPHLLELSGSLLRPEWKSLEVIENVETTVHRILRTQDPGAAVPLMRAERISPDEVELVYRSPRRLCALAAGICHGLAAHFGEMVTTRDLTCMHRGDADCRIRVSRA